MNLDSSRSRDFAGPFAARHLGLFLGIALAVSVVGCGNNVSDLAYQAVTASGNTALDLLLTQFANQVADAFDQPASDTNDGDINNGDTGDDSANDGGDTGGDGGDGGADNNGGGGEALVGDAATGQQVFLASGCNACHADDASGAFGPALFGNDESVALDTRFGGGGMHNGLTLTEQEVADVAAWFLGDAGGAAGGAAAGDAAIGETTFADSCASCHGDDGTSGFAPDISGFAVDQITTGTSSATHDAITITDEDIANIAAFLAG